MLTTKKTLFITMLLFILIFAFPFDIYAVQENSYSQVQAKLVGISEEEKEILVNLFTMTKEIEELERMEEEINRDITNIENEIKKIEGDIYEEEIIYKEKKDLLKQVLRNYQKKGPGSFLEIVLDSENLSEMLGRINILRDFSRNTKALLDTLQISKEMLYAQKNDVSEKLIQMEEKKSNLKESINSKKQFRDEKERFLVSLNEERSYYEEYLSELQKSWDELKPLFTSVTEEISQIVEEGNLPSDALEISFSLLGMTGSINEKSFNHFIAQHTNITKMLFSFHTEKVEIEIPEKNFVVSGKFLLLDDYRIKFEVEEGIFNEVPLDKKIINELFQEEGMVWNLKKIIGSNKLRSIEIKEGYLELKISMGLF